MQISELCFCGDRVYLAHVPAMILFFDIRYVKEPCSMLIMLIVRNTDPWISRDYMIMYGQNGRLFEMDPRNLSGRKRKRVREKKWNCSILINRFVVLRWNGRFARWCNSDWMNVVNWFVIVILIQCINLEIKIDLSTEAATADGAELIVSTHIVKSRWIFGWKRNWIHSQYVLFVVYPFWIQVCNAC